jgi:hypothetical protein
MQKGSPVTLSGRSKQLLCFANTHLSYFVPRTENFVKNSFLEVGHMLDVAALIRYPRSRHCCQDAGAFAFF